MILTQLKIRFWKQELLKNPSDIASQAMLAMKRKELVKMKEGL